MSLWRMTADIYLGNQDAPAEAGSIDARSMVCMARELVREIHEDIPTIVFPIVSNRAVPEDMQGAIVRVVRAMIDEEKMPCIIYCRAGGNRSGGAVFLALTRLCGLTNREAFDLMREVRGRGALCWSTDPDNIIELTTGPPPV